MSSLADIVLLPRPRDIRPAPGSFFPRPGMDIVLEHDAARHLFAARRVQEAGDRYMGMRWPLRAAGEGAGIVLSATADDLAPQHYRLTIAPGGITVTASDAAGLYYGAMTLVQVMRESRGPLPAGTIVDGPDFPVRGVMLDISRDRVPTMETLFGLVDELSAMKVNHLELYMEHTFAYTNHREVWAESSPITGEEILLLDACCRERFVELVPNQNSFGHLARWLSLPRYAALAECPDGFTFPWGARSSGPFSLDPSNPGSLALLDELFAELLPHFPAGLFNVGCDETWDLGQGKSRELCARRGKGRVYLDFLDEIHRRVRGHGKTMLYWGDIVVQHPELVTELPRDAVALEWGYEAAHPFETHGALFQAAGVPWWVCPGTSSWNSIAGRTENCLANIRSAARAGLSRGAAGFLNTDWGDNGHWQPLSVSFLGFAAGAALSWCVAANAERDFQAELDAHVFCDAARVMGAAVSEMGNAYRTAGKLIMNASPLFSILAAAPGSSLPEGVTKTTLADTRRVIEDAASKLDAARMERHDSGLVRDELANTARLLLFSCDRGTAILDDTLEAFRGSPRAREELRVMLGEFRRLWVARSRVGGLSDSTRRFAPLLPADLQV